MKTYKVILFLLLAVFAQHLNAQEVKKPIEVFGFYFDVFVRYDDQALTKLNDYLKPAVAGKDAYQVNLKNVSEEMIKTSAENFLSVFPKDVAAACKKESEDYFRVLYENFQNGKMSVKKIDLVQNEYVPDQKIAKVTYSVSFKVPSQLSEVIVPDSQKAKSEDLKKFLSQVIEKFKKADKTVTTDQEFSLYGLNQDGKVYYWNGSPDQITSSLIDFYFEGFGIK
ncbi:hypothetical protein CEY12_13440 [Chryseobacterium sp. T16E-39]|uniref:hypothetical protein n=1 Tax=Chryseobacterium sp. T16E-39 TaxID=2015076 RepID=UPI000B5B1C53|nr:hypothetical protein [Chryseobacterium sp. T16E-39]ASK31048.1 hypothetical protein CEY12_13440 [Chryseobacterium sp. T16E-39]